VYRAIGVLLQTALANRWADSTNSFDYKDCSFFFFGFNHIPGVDHNFL
jgi:hypothetical protein